MGGRGSRVVNRAHNLVTSRKRDWGDNLRAATRNFGVHWQERLAAQRADAQPPRERGPREAPADYYRMLEARQNAREARQNARAANQANLAEGRLHVRAQLDSMARSGRGGGKRLRRNGLYDLHGWPAQRPLLDEPPTPHVSQLKRPRTPDRVQQDLDQSALTHQGARAKRMMIARHSAPATPDDEILGGPGEGQVESPAGDQGGWGMRMDDDY